MLRRARPACKILRDDEPLLVLLRQQGFIVVCGLARPTCATAVVRLSDG
jgi:hypothetical protein